MKYLGNVNYLLDNQADEADEDIYEEIDTQLIRDLVIASWQGDLEKMTHLLDVGVSPDAELDHGLSPLHGAASYRRPEAISLLVSRGATINKPDNDGATPLHRAAVSNCPATIQMLLEKGADKHLQNKYNRTPLDEAHKRNCTVAIDLLEKHGLY